MPGSSSSVGAQRGDQRAVGGREQHGRRAAHACALGVAGRGVVGGGSGGRPSGETESVGGWAYSSSMVMVMRRLQAAYGCAGIAQVVVGEAADLHHLVAGEAVLR